MFIKHKKRTNRNVVLIASVWQSQSWNPLWFTIQFFFHRIHAWSVNITNRFNPFPNSKQILIFSCMRNFGKSTETNSLSKEAATMETRSSLQECLKKPGLAGVVHTQSVSPIHSPLEPMVWLLMVLYNNNTQYRTTYDL